MTLHQPATGVINYDDFLKHQSSGGGGSYLKKWKDDGEVDVWLHPKAGVAVRWAHSFWHVTEKKEKGEKVTVIWSYRFICHEKAVILGKQRYRTDENGGVPGNGRREFPPQVCPECMAIEHFRDEVRAGRLSWTAPLFAWELPDDTLTITVGGFCGLFSKDRNEYSKAQLEEMNRARIEQSEIYEENATARCDYIMRVVADADPSAGCVIAPVADSLGRKIQKAIRDRIEATNARGIPPEKRYVPSRDTLCLRWKYDANQDFDRKYEVVTLGENVPSEDVLAALADEPPPIADLVSLGNVAQLRAQMEQHCLVKGVPWDTIFKQAERLGSDAGDFAAEAEAAALRARPQAAAPVAPPAVPPPVQAAAAASVPAVSAEPYECEVCGGPNSSEVKCRHCGAEYDSFTGALTYNPKLPVSDTNLPGVKPAAAAPAAPAAPPTPAPAADVPAAGRRPSRRRASS